MMIEYVPYERVNELYFNDSPEKAIEVFGEPDLKSRDYTGNLEFYYRTPDKNDFAFKIIFDENDKFSEFLLYPSTKAQINGIPIGWTLEDIKPIISKDSNPRMDDYGIILYDLGIAFGSFRESDSIGDRSINLFRKGELDEFIKDTEPYDVNSYI